MIAFSITTILNYVIILIRQEKGNWVYPGPSPSTMAVVEEDFRTYQGIWLAVACKARLHQFSEGV